MRGGARECWIFRLLSARGGNGMRRALRQAVDGRKRLWESIHWIAHCGPLRAYWRDPTATNREALRAWLTREGIREQYFAGVPAELPERFAPETHHAEIAELMLDFLDRRMRR